MIIYGTTNITLSGDRGQFYCPRCARTDEYRRRNVRRFFTLYFIPLIPLEMVESYVECLSCKGRYTLDALALSKDDYERKSKDAFAQILLRAMVVIMIADGMVDDAELTEVQRLYEAASSRPLSRDELVQQVAMAQQSGLDTLKYFRQITPHLTEDQKNEIVRCCFLVSTAAGELREEQMEELRTIPAVLDMPESRFRDIVEDAANGA